ncbi:MAG: pilin [Candidatus Peribacteraceae bacterium]|nr:pilin [Candidatus Peribacteraceae bacterium]
MEDGPAQEAATLNQFPMRKIFLSAAIAFLACVQPVLAAESTGGVGIIDAAKQIGITDITCPEGVVNCKLSEEATQYSIESTQEFVLKLIGGILSFAAIIAVVMLIIAAIRLVTAHGSQDALAAAKKHIMWSLAGLVIIILSLLIVQNVTKIIFENTEQQLTTAVAPEKKQPKTREECVATMKEAIKTAQGYVAAADSKIENIYNAAKVETQEIEKQLKSATGSEAAALYRKGTAINSEAEALMQEEEKKLMAQYEQLRTSENSGAVDCLISGGSGFANCIQAAINQCAAN